MTKFGSAFMMKSPFHEHGDKLRKEAMRLSKESSGRDDAPDYDNPKVVKLLDQAKKADKSHESDSPAQMATASYRRTPMDTETYYGGEIDVPDITSVGKLAGFAVDKAVGGLIGKDVQGMSDQIREDIGESQRKYGGSKTDSSGEDCPPGCK